MSKLYKVQPGDTLSKIVTRFSIHLGDLLAANPGIRNPNTIFKGQMIIIPEKIGQGRAQTSGGGRPAAATPRAPLDTQLSLEYLSPFCGASAEDKNMEFSRLKHVADRIATDHKVTRRADWGTMKPDLSKLDMDGCYNTVVVHHTGDGNTQSLAEIERKHMTENGWNNVGYHYIVDRAGKIHEGTPLGYKGTHVKAANTGKIGIVLIGDYDHQRWDFSDDDLPAVQFDAAVNLIKSLKTFTGTQALGGHRDFVPGADCPGDLLYGKLGDIRTRTKLAGPKK